MRKAVFASLIILLLSISLSITIVNANPIFPATKIDIPQDAIPPTISINYPQNKTHYTETFNFRFNIQCPQYKGYSGYVYEVTYIIDNLSITIPPNDILANGYFSKYNGSFAAPILAAGNHSLIVEASAIYYQRPGANCFIIKGISQVYFTTSDISTNGSDNSALDNKVTLPTIYLVTIITLIVVAVASVPLAYFKRKRGKP
jgi:hypothetical protein